MASNPHSCPHTAEAWPSPTSLSPFIPSLSHRVWLCNILHGLSTRPCRHPLSALPFWAPYLPALLHTGGSGSSSSCVEAEACAGPHTRHLGSAPQTVASITCFKTPHWQLLIPELTPSNSRSQAMLLLSLCLHSPSPCTSSRQGPEARRVPVSLPLGRSLGYS